MEYSTFDMPDHLCRHQWLIRRYLTSLPRQKSVKTEMPECNWRTLQKLVDLLKPMKYGVKLPRTINFCMLVYVQTATTFLEGEEYPTPSSAIPMIRGLLTKYSLLSSNGEFDRDFSNRMIKALKSRLGNTGGLLSEEPGLAHIATFLDPRYRSAYFSVSEKAAVRVFYHALIANDGG